MASPAPEAAHGGTPGCTLTPIAVDLVVGHAVCMFGLEIPTRVPGFAGELELIAPNQGLRSAELGIARRRMTEGKNS